MAETWGNGTDPPVQNNEDWVSNPDFHNVLKVNDVNEDDDDKIALHVINNSNNDDARALKVQGKTELGTIVNQSLSIGASLIITSTADNPSQIIAGQVADADTPSGQLYLNEEHARGHVIISHADAGVGNPYANVEIRSPRLLVGTNGIAGQIDTNGVGGAGDHLKLGTRNVTNHVEIGRTQQWAAVKGPLNAEEHIRVGGTGAGADGKVDAASNARDLKLGTDANATNNVQISRSGKEADVKGRLDAEEHIRVGGTGVGADGKVDAAASNRDLKLGTDSNYTNHVIIGRSGRVVEVTGGTIWLNALHTFGLDLNEAGHNPGHPSIDVYISGAVEAYIDDQGIHNA